MKGFTDFTVSSGYVQVLCDALWRLVAARTAGTVHVTSSDALTKYGFGVAVAETFGLDASLITPTAADVIPPRQGDLSLDVSKVAAVLGSPLPTQREGIAMARDDAAGLRSALASAGHL